MKNLLRKLERLFAAVAFAEAGERETVKSLLDERKTVSGKVHRLGDRQTTLSSSPARPARRAA